MNVNRRIFLAVLGAAGGAAMAWRPASSRFAEQRPMAPVHFFAERPAEPTARPKSSAIRYLPVQHPGDIPYA